MADAEKWLLWVAIAIGAPYLLVLITAIVCCVMHWRPRYSFRLFGRTFQSPPDLEQMVWFSSASQTVIVDSTIENRVSTFPDAG